MAYTDVWSSTGGKITKFLWELLKAQCRPNAVHVFHLYHRSACVKLILRGCKVMNTIAEFRLRTTVQCLRGVIASLGSSAVIRLTAMSPTIASTIRVDKPHLYVRSASTELFSAPYSPRGNPTLGTRRTLVVNCLAFLLSPSHSGA